MGKDYYQILQINRDATNAEIAKSYRRLALKFHPKLTKEEKNTAYHHFCSISEAYEVLNDPIKRSFFDQFGEEKLKDGFFEEGQLLGGYQFGGNPEEIFEKFFGNDNPFAQIYDTHGDEELGSLFSHAFGAMNFKGLAPLRDVEVPVYCTLNELYNGCSKEITYTRVILNRDGITTTEIEETRTLQIKPGYSNTTTIKFNCLGNEGAGLKNSNLIFKIVEKPHEEFKRKDNDLVIIVPITLAEALCSDSLNLKMLDGRKLFIAMDQIITQTTVKIIPGEGMPIYSPDEFTVENFNKPPEKGDLYLKFDIEFPTTLPAENKEILKQIIKI